MRLNQVVGIVHVTWATILVVGVVYLFISQTDLITGLICAVGMAMFFGGAGLLYWLMFRKKRAALRRPKAGQVELGSVDVIQHARNKAR
jgi:protein-S-isoprenylcysteine O-methyltransferase Ste14